MVIDVSKSEINENQVKNESLLPENNRFDRKNDNSNNNNANAEM